MCLILNKVKEFQNDFFFQTNQKLLYTTLDKIKLEPKTLAHHTTPNTITYLKWT